MDGTPVKCPLSRPFDGRLTKHRMEWSKVKSSQLKLVAAGIGAGALVAMGALTVVFSDAPGAVSEGPSWVRPPRYLLRLPNWRPHL